MRNIISVTGDADDAALKSLRGDWKTYSRLRGITIEVSRRVTHRGSWKWCCLNVRGRSCKSLDETRLSSIISISAIIQRSPRFRAHLTHARLPYSLLEMRSTSTSLSTSAGVVHANACCSPGNGSIEEIRKASPSCISHRLRTIYPPTLKFSHNIQPAFYVFCTNGMHIVSTIFLFADTFLECMRKNFWNLAIFIYLFITYILKYFWWHFFSSFS